MAGGAELLAFGRGLQSRLLHAGRASAFIYGGADVFMGVFPPAAPPASRNGVRWGGGFTGDPDIRRNFREVSWPIDGGPRVFFMRTPYGFGVR